MRDNKRLACNNYRQNLCKHRPEQVAFLKIFVHFLYHMNPIIHLEGRPKIYRAATAEKTHSAHEDHVIGWKSSEDLICRL